MFGSGTEPGPPHAAPDLGVWQRLGVDQPDLGSGTPHVRRVRIGPTTHAGRVLAPDLARGVALLGIALANCVVYISGRELGPLQRPVDGSQADRVVDVLVGLFVDNRAFPMFTMLFAYGYVMLLRRLADRGVPWPQARGVLLRRSLWLALIGAAHLMLLFFGDIVLSYGLLGLILVLVIRWSDRALRLVGWATLVVFAGFAVLDGFPGALDRSFGGLVEPTSYVGDLVLRAAVLGNTLLSAPLLVLAFMPPAVVGILLGRRRVLEEPAAHVPLLRRLALVGLAVSMLGAVPLVLLATQTVQVGGVLTGVAAVLHGVTGLVGSVAFIAWVGWFVGSRALRPATGPRVERRGVVGALAAVGERSLTCYLLQSVLFVPLLSPWALGLGAEVGTATVSAVAVGVYLVTMLVAVLLARAGRSGPAEWFLRRMTYGQPPGEVPQRTGGEKGFGSDGTGTQVSASGPPRRPAAAGDT